MDVPPPPPPHGSRTSSGGRGRGPKSGGLPDGKYDIFVIPPSSAGSGFLYLPSLQTNRNSFLAGVACTSASFFFYSVAVPVIKEWFHRTINSGGSGVLMLVCSVGVIAWALGKTQAEGFGFPNEKKPEPQPETSNRRPRRSRSEQMDTDSEEEPPPPPRRPPPRETRGEHTNSNDTGAHTGYTGAPEPKQSQQPPPQPQQPQQAPPQPPPPQPPQPPPPPQEPSPQPQPPPAQEQPPQSSPPKSSWQRPTTDPKAKADAKSSWEKAREETRKREEDKRRQEELKRRRDELEKERLRQREREARERLERELKEKKERELKDAAAQKEREEREAARIREREEREAAVKKEKEERERKEKLEQEEKERKEKLEKEERDRRERDIKDAVERERKNREMATKEKELRDKEEALRKETERINAERIKAAVAAATAARKPPIPTAKTEKDDDAYSFRPYDRAKSQKTGSAGSVYSDDSYAPSATTAKTTPPGSDRGPYSTKDPDKIILKAVYSFNNAFIRTPIAQLISGQGNVTDGLILRITTEGLFIDDDVRGVPQREWDVKAWTMKQAETCEVSGKHVLRASIRDQEGKKYVFIIGQSEGWKVSLGLQRLRKGSQVRALGVTGMPMNEAKSILDNLGWS